MYHINVNGVPHCQAPIYELEKAAGLTAKQWVSIGCGYGEKRAEAEADAAKLAAVLPGVKVEVVACECGKDPWWKTPEGLAAIAIEDELNDYRSNEEREIDSLKARLATALEPKKVTIEVSGGVAEVTECPEGVEVEIIDHDDLKAESEARRRKCPKCQGACTVFVPNRNPLHDSEIEVACDECGGRGFVQ